MKNIKNIKKTYKPNKKCCDTEKCCNDIQWTIGYLIGETISCIVNICLNFVNNASKGFDSRSKSTKYH